MNILLGNLSISQIESRLGIAFPEDLKKFMADTHQDSASNIAKGKWHCFDIPFQLVCGDMETAQKIFDALKPQASLWKEALRFSIQN